MSLVPVPASLPAAPSDPLDAFVAPFPPDPQQTFFGINLNGQLYVYGDTPAQPKRVYAENDGLRFYAIAHLEIMQKVHRPYLDLTLQSTLPHHLCILSLPCQGSPQADGGISLQWSVRSLLGALLAAADQLDLRATSGILRARRGTGGVSGFRANFVDLAFDSASGDEQRLKAPAIGGSRDALEVAVNQVRRSLGLHPQFP
jgi:hypothetical protein